MANSILDGIEKLIERDYIEYRYRDRFSYDLFVERMTPVLLDCIESPSLAGTSDAADTFIEDEVDYSYELEEMLERIGLKKYDGKRVVDLEFDCTYIDAVTSSFDEFGRTIYSRFPVNVLATVRITSEEDID